MILFILFVAITHVLVNTELTFKFRSNHVADNSGIAKFFWIFLYFSEFLRFFLIFTIKAPYVLLNTELTLRLGNPSVAGNGGNSNFLHSQLYLDSHGVIRKSYCHCANLWPPPSPPSKPILHRSSCVLYQFWGIPYESC
jgi:hypothetical protein